MRKLPDRKYTEVYESDLTDDQRRKMSAIFSKMNLEATKMAAGRVGTVIGMGYVAPLYIPVVRQRYSYI